MIISDVRFENEAAWIRNLGGVVIHVVRGGAPPVNAHTSEAGVARAPEDRVLLNNASLEELQDATYELLDGVME